MRSLIVTPLGFDGMPAAVGSGVEALSACLEIPHRSLATAESTVDELADLDLVVVEGVPACDALVVELGRRERRTRLVYWAEGRLAGLASVATEHGLRQLDALVSCDLVATVNERTNSYYGRLSGRPVRFWGLPYYEHATRGLATDPTRKDRRLVALGGELDKPTSGVHGPLAVVRSLGLRALVPGDEEWGRRWAERGFEIESMPPTSAYGAARAYARAYAALQLDPRDTWGRFSLDCAAVGVPCVGSDRVQTQGVLFPELTVDPLDVEGARDLLARLVADVAFHGKARDYALRALDQFGFSATRKRIERSLLQDLSLKTS